MNIQYSSTVIQVVKYVKTRERRRMGGEDVKEVGVPEMRCEGIEGEGIERSEKEYRHVVFLCILELTVVNVCNV